MKAFFSSMRVSNKIAAIFLSLLFMVGIGGAVGLHSALKIEDVTKLLYLESFKRTETLSSVEKELMLKRQAVFMHIVVSDEGSMSFLESSIKESGEKADNLLSAYGSYKLSEEFGKSLGGFISSLDEYRKVEINVLNLSSKNKDAEALSLMRGEGTMGFNRTFSALRGLLDAEKTFAATAYQESEYFAAVVTIITIFLTVGAIVIAVWFWHVLTRAIVRPILAIEESAKRMAEGDLRQRAAVLGGDEIGSLAAEFNKMAESLEESHATLEKKVEERTEESRAAYEELALRKRELEIKNAELVRASRMKSQFLANVSHELRTPLNSIIGFSELLQERSFGELNEKQQQYSKFIHTSGVHLLQLINSILDLSKIEAGRMELMPEEFPLTDLLGEILGTIKPIAHKKNVTIETKVTPASPIMVADKGKFKQIMYNLLSNAVKFNIEGGKVLIDWDIKDEPVGMKMYRYIYLSIKDTGVGIKEEDMKRLFREFEQLDPTITREHGGTGLGLALTQKLVELHKGRIWVDSKTGVGTTFTVKMPLGTQSIEVVPPPAILTPMVIEPAKEEKPLILVAGEGGEINHLLEAYLTEEGRFDVITALDGVALIEKAVELRPFAIVMGITLPKKDGWEVIKELKGRNETRDIPVVIISAANNRELGFALGAVDYMVKPVDREKLLGTIGRLNFAKDGKKHQLTILAVDDEPQVLTLLGDILGKEGFSVLKASSGEEAVRMAIDNEPDLLILDLMMPGLSGFDVIERLRKHPAASEIPVIIFTAKDITQEDKSRLGTSIKKIIRKAGFSREDLLAEIRLLELAYPGRANMLDRTTALFNRRYFDIMLQREIARAARYGENFSLLFVDIDDFGQYNRTNGITNGDEALRDLARLFTDNLRKADYVTRYGGDEFAILLPNITGNEAYQVAEKLRILTERNSFPAFEEKGKLTVSLGVATWAAGGAKADMMEKLKVTVKDLLIEGGNRVMACGGSTGERR